jgi:CHAD domain-containing protein
MARHAETERKYEVPSGMKLPDGDRLFDLAVGSSDEVELDATYFDTDDLRLARSGVTLRHRAGGDDAGWHLKLPVDADTREELQLPLGSDLAQPPARFVALTRVYSRGRRLEPVAKLVTKRRRRILTGADGHELAELADDQVHGIRFQPAVGELDWRELEVELVGDGSIPLLEALEAELGAIGARRSAAPSKLSRLLGDRLPPSDSPEQPGKGAAAGVVVLAYVREQARVLRSLDPLVRLDAPDAVHKMRVTARRLRSALQGHRRIIDRDAAAALIADLRWLGAELAPARDAEVLSARFTAAVGALPTQEVLGPVAGQLTRRFGREQAEGHARAVAALDSDRYLQLQQRIDRLLADPPLTCRGRRRAERELPRAIGKAMRRTTACRFQADGAAEAERDAALHEMRKAAKRARYVLEVAEPAMGKRARKLRKRIKAVQSLLGDHHDTVVARPVLRELGAQARIDGGNGFSFGILYAREHAAARHLDDQLTAAWKRVEKHC